MTRKSNQEINFTFDQGRKSKSAAHKKRMPIVRCICGSEILVVPDLKAMNRAIRNHVAEHNEARDGSDRLNSLTGFLTERVLMVASKIDLPNVN
jgi:hypothetical protein